MARLDPFNRRTCAEVAGRLGKTAASIHRVRLLQRPRDPDVQLGAPQPGHPVIEGAAHQLVREPNASRVEETLSIIPRAVAGCAATARPRCRIATSAPEAPQMMCALRRRSVDAAHQRLR
jgi:hypothetical protein